MSRTKKIAILAIIAMVLTLLPVSLFAATADSDRLSGADRIGTAIEVADAGWTTAGTVILAPADQANLVDALAAAPLAGQENAPILLTFKGGLSDDVKAKIVALGATKVYVVGAISDSVVAEVNALAGVTAEKLSGANRWATADAINAKLTSPAGSFVVGYNAIPDALSVASYAAAKKFAIVLTNADGTVNASKLVGATTYLVGGTTVVKDYAGATRLGGADRFATNTAVAQGLSYDYARVYVANGLSMVDALAVAPLAAKYGAFVALASATNVAAASTVNAKLTASSKVIAVGGLNAVSAAVVGQVGVAVVSGLSVVSAQAVNSKQLVIKFNKAVDKSTLIDGDNLVNGIIDVARIPAGTSVKDVDISVAYAHLTSDGMTLTLVADDDEYFDGTYSLHIADGVVSKDAKDDLGKYTTTFSISDKTAPTVVSVKYNSATDKIDVVVSEPVEIEPVVTVNNGSPRQLTANKLGTTLSFDNAWAKGTTVTVRVSGAVDYNDNEQASLFTQSVKIDMDENPVGVTSIAQESSNEIKVVFDKAISNIATGAIAVYRGGVNYFDDVAQDTSDSSKRTWIITLTGTGPDYAFYGGSSINNTTVNVVFVEKLISDVFGNTNAEITRNVAMAKDKAGPVIASAKLSANEEMFVVRFNESIVEVGVGSLDEVTVRVDGVDITGDFYDISIDGKAIVLDYADKIPNGTYTIRVGKDAVKDEHGNKNATQTSSITITGSTSPVTGSISSAGTNAFYVNYNDKVGASAVVPGNYTLNGVALPSTTDIYFTGTDKQEVKIVLEDNSINYSSTTAILRVAKVTDTDGNKITAFSDTVALVDNVKPILQSATLNGNVLTLNFDEDMKSSVISGTTVSLTNLLAELEIKGGSLALTAGDGSAYVTVDGKKVILSITAGTSNWNTVKAYSSITVKTKDNSVLLVDKNEGNMMKKDVTITVQKV